MIMVENRGWKKGTKHSEETRVKMKETRNSEEYRFRMSNALKGRQFTPGHVKKISQARLGPVSLRYGCPASGRLRSLKTGAEKRNLSWVLTDDQACAMILSPCHYCGISSNSDRPNGIDRLANFIGYLVENCVSCCDTCNRAKFVFTSDEFLDWVRRVAENQCMLLASSPNYDEEKVAS